MNKLFAIFAFLCIGGNSLLGQELPPINIYTTKDYQAENQNWGIAQSKEQFIYVANNKGLLEFNGAHWKLYPSPNGTIFRSVNVIGDKIYTGFYRNFGYWKKNELGVLVYTSLTDELNIPLLEDEQFWNIIELDGWILFQSLQRIYLFNQKTKNYSYIEGKSTITKMALINGVIYFQDQSEGVFKISNGSAQLVSDHPIFKQNVLVGMYQKGKDLFLVTQDNGIFIVQNDTVVAWETPANKILQSQSIYNSIQLRNEGFAFGTISNGFYNVNKDGIVNYHINQPKGLSNNTILSLFEDINQNIWLGLDNGINTVNLSSPFRIYKDKDGFLGTIYTAITFNDYVYLGTNQGLFYKTIGSSDNYTFIPGTQGQVWSLTAIDDTLFCGHNSGTFSVEKDKTTWIAREPGTWGVKKINENLLLQGNYYGLHILEKKGGSWTYKNKIEGFNNSSRFVEFIEPTELFVNHEYKGVFKLKIDPSFEKVVEVTKDTSVTKGVYSSIVSYRNKILYANKHGVYAYNTQKNSFERDSIYSKLYKEEEYTSGKLVYDNYKNSLWGFSSKNIGLILPSVLSNIPTVDYIPITESIRKGANGFENITHLKEDIYLLGTSDGYISIDLSKITPLDDFNIHLLDIHYSVTEGESHQASFARNESFKSYENTLVFNYSTPYYGKFNECEYQYILEGYTENWSPWTKNSTVEFKNLESGTYEFKVRSRIGNKISSNTSSYTFSIEKKWYYANAMIIVYICCVLIFSLIMHQIYKRYYTKKQVVLLEKSQRDMKVKELEDKQEIMRLRNEKLQADIENTNKELATATMSIIKKNEFLNTIKKELKSVEGPNFNKVIKIIDKNLNNTDDWKLFQEAFNNADKDFLKKVKVKHPSLTPNDLRLCAYLRLNLSSKEIAPLLNISPRSVEVKRYRLRKKMNLAHDSSLTNYILEI